ncbi:gliding motility-associated C-terminal domain-containing protein [Hufsiella ginkgonis]|uniref:T9SS type B sorting domain-containing protein n=1 Tax=Hufsiella ginkgonis TaxID=2695274 RepID=A0A7K1Y459_9SPHI|nr:gliding motility-associated C-terminal domain-containing protein [Hufsiella ginkgonis]MXV17486.1 T9SS type B sorting domain-containing protein [Hufsiella ginkgonis]
MVKKFTLLIFFCLFLREAFAQTPENDECGEAIELPSEKEYCSGDNAFTSTGSTPTFKGGENDVWFTYTPRHAYDVYFTVYGEGQGGTLRSPQINMYANCAGPGGTYNEVVGKSVSADNVVTLYEGQLTIGRTYYVRVSGATRGTFKICIENRDSPVRAGQDCISAKRLCSMETVREIDITGPGAVLNEGQGTCLVDNLGRSESNSAWYKFTAANNGTFVFTITPTVTSDDIDWAFFDLGISGDCGTRTVLRCAAGNGQLINCPRDAPYYKTGLDFNSQDLSEDGGCNTPGQVKDGKVKYVDLVKGHVYALLVNNPYSQNNGFSLAFTDQAGKAGTARFVGPEASITLTENSPCLAGQSFSFTTTPNSETSSIRWIFGEADDASITASTTNVNVPVTYRKLGVKTVVLEATGFEGCKTMSTVTFNVGLTPTRPIVTASSQRYCIDDTIRLSVTEFPSSLYHWNGPNNFSYVGKKPVLLVPVKSGQEGGTYTVYLDNFGCTSETVSIDVTGVLERPVAAFSTSPGSPGMLANPTTVKFTNNSRNATNYLWDFGDGSTSTEENPEHTYSKNGDYKVKLTATNQDVCSMSVIQGRFAVREYGFIFVPNTFTPNNDGVNDEFVVTLLNISNYHIRIFNRWGTLLFESSDIFNNWKGTFREAEVPVGTYYYLITGIDGESKHLSRSGSITVIR